MTVSGLLAILVGATVLLGWWLKVDALTSLVPGLLTMKVRSGAAGRGALGIGDRALRRAAGVDAECSI